jgi:hypothetical protein
MFQSLMLFLAPGTDPVATAVDSRAQSTQPSPPAVARPTPLCARGRVPALCFCARVIGNALGFAVLFSGCWLTLQLMAVFL